MDPEAREIVYSEPTQDSLFAYQYRYPMDYLGVIIAKTMMEALADLNAKGIEPFSITRVGMVL